MTYSTRQHEERLDYYYRAVQAIILNRQNPTTGLIPASVAVTTHGDYRDAWVRDNVYSIFAVFGLALAYRRLDDAHGRAYELQHTVVKLMRGLLFCMMRQAHKVEQFKNTQHIHHCLHAKYNTNTGDSVVGDTEWGHLQLDATSIYILSLAQMTAAGLHIIYTLDEVDFVQNLVFYIERSYRTPDYGIWERGNKINHGEPELNSSSIGMAVAALQAINGVNLFGSRGGPSSVIHVLPDEITRNYIILHSTLPRESKSKEVDAALLSVIGFPAFAVGDPNLISKTQEEIVTKLGGKYGCKRFLRDGHQTVVEDTSRLHYDAYELKIFENIECEWPLFFTYFILNGLFQDDYALVEQYRRALAPLLVDSSTLGGELGAHVNEALPRGEFDGCRIKTPRTPSTPGYLPENIMLVPELYYVPSHLVNAEKAVPHSQTRVPNDNIPLVWANSLYILGNLIYENLLTVSEVDPLGRRLNAVKPHPEAVVQLVLISENGDLQQKLAMYGLETQTVDQVAPVTISPPSALKEVYTALGYNAKLGFSGRPRRPVGTLSTCKLYRVQGHIYAFTPHFMDNEEFYLTSDNDYLVSVFEHELAFVAKHWGCTGRPSMVCLLTSAMLGGAKASQQKMVQPEQARGNLSSRRGLPLSGLGSDKRNLLHFMMTLRTGMCNGVRVRLGRLSEMINTSFIESLDFLVNKNEIDWFGILRGATRVGGRRKLGLSQSDGTHTPHRRPVRRSISAGASGNLSGLATPAGDFGYEKHSTLASLSPTTPSSYYHGSYFPPLISPLPNAVFKLKDHEDYGDRGSPSTRRTNVLDSEGSTHDGSLDSLQVTLETSSESVDGGAEALALTLGDNKDAFAAVNLLESSVNLFDQIDVLHYLHSCYGPSYVVEPLETSIENLLEEVYMKALQLRLWSVVRQAAGLLRKVVNSLTINITDLLIRQKHITIGPSDNEFVIDTPVGPDVLSKVIYEHCYGDVREAPLVQEVITYLGSFIRADVRMFAGIIRIRTHYVIIALREEMSRIKVCDEEDAVEYLMQLSPFEVKSLLGTVMSGPSLCGVPAAGKVGGDNFRFHCLPRIPIVHTASTEDEATMFPSTAAAAESKMAENSEPVVPMVEITARSGGYTSGNFSYIRVNGIAAGVSVRGMNVCVIDPVTGALLDTVGFDTHLSEEDSEDFARYIEYLEPGTIVVLCCKDDVTEHLTEGAKAACEQLGSSKIRHLKYRDSWCLIGQKGGQRSGVVEDHVPAGPMPTKCIAKVLELAPVPALTVPALALDSRQSTELIGPSQGRWLRRRKNDGTLNRVPANFYPRCWKILDRSTGIRIAETVLPRLPTVNEKTPEELSFVLQVEHFLAVIRDPAERQIATETLEVIYKLQERAPEAAEKAICEIDLLQIMQKAMVDFWGAWVNKQKEQHARFCGVGAPGEAATDGGQLQVDADVYSRDLSFDANEVLARRLFYDLPHDGEEGVEAYLDRSAATILPYGLQL